MKSLLLTVCILLTAQQGFSQYQLAKGGKQLNAGFGFSSWGVPVYAGIDFGVHKDISVGGELSYRSYSNKYFGTKYNHSILAVGANGNYHFSNVFSLPHDWDIYAGLNLTFYSWSEPAGYKGVSHSGAGMGLQLGTRYYFKENLGLNLEFGGGTTSGGKIGISYKF